MSNRRKKRRRKRIRCKKALKEIRFKWRTAPHDFNFKLKHARGFIEDGNKVKASVMFRGRELAHSDIGRDLLLKFIEEMSDIAKVDNPLSNEGRSISVTLSPLKGSRPTKSSRPLKSEQKN
jgi:translation initiation factor IF-3